MSAPGAEQPSFLNLACGRKQPFGMADQGGRPPLPSCPEANLKLLRVLEIVPPCR
jgi:hypothetical protein